MKLEDREEVYKAFNINPDKIHYIEMEKNSRFGGSVLNSYSLLFAMFDFFFLILSPPALIGVYKHIKNKIRKTKPKTNSISRSYDNCKSIMINQLTENPGKSMLMCVPDLDSFVHELIHIIALNMWKKDFHSISCLILKILSVILTSISVVCVFKLQFLLCIIYLALGLVTQIMSAMIDEYFTYKKTAEFMCARINKYKPLTYDLGLYFKNFYWSLISKKVVGAFVLYGIVYLTYH